MTGRPSVSVVTVNRNNAAGLAHTCASLTAQAGADFEWIVVDGDSTDDSVQVARDHGQVLSPTVISEPDEGIYDAMNKGLATATGRVVLFLNSGDRLTAPRTLATAVELLGDDHDAWGYGGLRHLDAQGRAVSGTVFAPFRPRLLALGLRVIPHQAAYLPRDFLNALGGFRVDFGLAADQELLYRASLRRPPRAWVEFMADVEPGGVGSSRPPHAFPLDMRRARALSGQRTGGPLADALATGAGVTIQSALVWQSRVRGRLRGESP